MPWAVKECGRRGAMGAISGGLLLAFGRVTYGSFAKWSAGRGLMPYTRHRLDCQRCIRLVDRRVVWLGFSGCHQNGPMLFNSYSFIFIFLPIALAGYFWAGRSGNLAAVWWLALASLVFYSVSNWQFVPLLAGSVA